MESAPKPRRRFGKWQLIIGGVVLLVLVGGGIAAFGGRGAQTNVPGEIPGWTTETTTTGSIDAAVNTTGAVAAQAQAELRFSSDGVVTEILVQPGEMVSAGQALARIERVDAELAVARAEADLKQAQATLTDLTDGPTSVELKEAQARVTEAQARYDQAIARYSDADIAAARARVEQARARLAQLNAGPRDEDRRDAVAQLERARAGLDSQRDTLSANKTQAELELERAVTDLTRAQANYATAKQNWEFVNTTGQDPTNPTIRDATGKELPNKVGDTQRQQYYDAFVQAEAGLRAAEIGVERARVSYDAARQGEVSGMREAEQQLAAAQAAYDRTMASATSDQLAEARAALASAQADLARLTGADKTGDLAVAQAQLENAQIALEKLLGEADAASLTRAEADVTRAEAALIQAQRQLEQTTLSAPFDATIAKVNMRLGERAGATAAIVVVDMRSFHIDVPVDELDIAQIRTGQTVIVQLDALLGREFNGAVATISPLATSTDRGTNTYEVTVALNEADPAIKPGMTASLQVVTERKENVVLAPRRAIQFDGGASYVLVPSADPAAAFNPAQPGERRTVTLGLSNNQSVEITSGLATGEQVLVPDIVQTFNPNIGG